MLGKHIIIPIHVAGTLAGNVSVPIPILADCHVRSVSAVASNANDATFTLGIVGDTDSILTANPVGDSNALATYGPANFAATNPTGRLKAGNVLTIACDYDGNAGTAAQNLTITVTLTEG